MAVVTTNLEVWYDSTNSASNTGSGTTLYDLSGNGRNGTINNPVRVANYFELENTTTNKSIEVPATFDSFMSGSSCQFSIEMWMWVNTAASNNTTRYRPFFTKDYDASFNGFIGMSERPTSAGGNQTAFSWYFLDPYQQTLSVTLQSGAWVQYVFVCDGVNKYLYQNGVLTNSATTSSAVITTSSQNFRFAPQIEGYYGWDGKFAIARVYSKALSAPEVLSNYNADKFSINKLAEFDFGSGSYPGSGTTVYDTTPFNNDLTFPNGLTYTTTYGGEAALTNTQSSYLIGSYPNNLPQGPVAHTMVLWGKYTSSYDVAMFANGGSAPAGCRIDLGYGFGSRLGGEIYGLGFNTALADTPAIGDWFQFVCVKPTNSNTETNADLVLYYNGKLSTTIPVTGTANISINSSGPIPSSAPGLAINWQGAPGNMEIIKASIYSGAWDQTQVTQDYYAFRERLNTPFISYDLSDVTSYSGSGNTVYDLSGNNNDLTLYNGPTFGGSGQAKYLKFDGVNDYAVGLGFTGFGYGSVATKLTRFVWCQLDSVSTDQWMTSLGYYGSPDFCVSEDLFSTVSSVWQWTPNLGANVSQINAGAISQSTWVNLAYVYDLDVAKVTAYVNGVEVGYTTGVSKYFDLSAGFGLCISGYIDKYTPTPTFNFGYPFDGKIGLLEYFDFAATSGEVLDYFNNTQARFLGPPPPTPYQGQVGGRTFGQGFAG